MQLHLVLEDDSLFVDPDREAATFGVSWLFVLREVFEGQAEEEAARDIRAGIPFRGQVQHAQFEVEKGVDGGVDGLSGLETHVAAFAEDSGLEETLFVGD